MLLWYPLLWCIKITKSNGKIGFFYHLHCAFEFSLFFFYLSYLTSGINATYEMEKTVWRKMEKVTVPMILRLHFRLDFSFFLINCIILFTVSYSKLHFSRYLKIMLWNMTNFYLFIFQFLFISNRRILILFFLVFLQLCCVILMIAFHKYYIYFILFFNLHV